MMEQFIKCSKGKALNIQAKRIQYAIDYRKRLSFDSVPVFTDIPCIGNISRDISVLLDYIYLSIDNVEDIPSSSKKLMKAIEGFKLNVKEFYIFKYKVSKLLQISAASDTILSLNDEEIARVSIMYFSCQLIEFIKYKTHKRLILGVKDNDVKYMSNDRLFLDTVNSKFLTEQEISLYEKQLTPLTLTLQDKHGITDREAIAVANDKIDEFFNGIRHDRILLDILSEDAKISTSLREKCLASGKYVVIDKKIMEMRNTIAEEYVTVHYSTGDIRTLRIKDIDIDNNYHCLVVNYVTADGHEDTQILSTSITNVLYSEVDDLYDKLVDLLMGNTKGDLVDNDFWKIRFSKDKDTQVRNYKRKVVTIHLHRAKLGNPSPKALELAKKYNIVLQPGETVVKTHPREYGKGVE